jgi:CDP-diacylglycerol--serine O-phosphatidyltransferase
MKITRAVVPSLFTVLNIFCGFLAIVHISHSNYVNAAWFIIIAALFDVLDGFMARLTKSYSDFGVELDSLADVISFGVAPSFLVYSMYLHTLDGLGMLISSMPMVFGAMRLARFNAQLVGYDKDYFKGLPIPSQAIALSTFVINYYGDSLGFKVFQEYTLVPLVVVLSFLMVSRFKYDTMPKFSKRAIAQHPWRFTWFIVGATAVILTQGKALFPVFMVYVFTGPLRYFYNVMKMATRPTQKADEEKETEISSVDV